MHPNKKLTVTLILTILIGLPCQLLASAPQFKTIGTMGKAVYPFTEGNKTEADLWRYKGKGCLNHMWFGGKWPDYEKMRIRVYVDGEAKASIDMELFLGHGIGFKDPNGPWGTQRIGKTGQPSGLYNTYRFHEEDPIFFEKGLRLTLRCGEQMPGSRLKPRAETWRAPPTTYTTYVWTYEWSAAQPTFSQDGTPLETPANGVAPSDHAGQ